jgi:predicted PurR-regulated permease PerM
MVNYRDGAARCPQYDFYMRSESTCPRCGTGRGVGVGAADGTRWALLRGAAESRGIPLWTIVTIVGLAAAIYVSGKLLYHLRDILIWLAVSGFLALILNPLVVMLQHRIAPRRSVAVAIVTVSAVLIFVGVAVGCGYPLAAGISHLANQLPGYVANAERGKGWAGHLLRRYHVQAWAQRNAPMLMNVGLAFGKSALAVGRSAVSLAATLTTVFTLTLLLLLEGPKLRAGILARMPPERAARCVEVAAEVRRSVAGYVVGNLLTSAIAGSVVLTTLLAVGVPFAPVWGLWVGLVDFLPIVGGALAGIPVILFASGHSVTAGIVTFVVFIVYTQVENHILNPLVMSRTVKISSLLVLVSVLAGYSIGSWIGGLFGGFVAGLLAIPSAGAIQILSREAWRAIAGHGRAGMAGIDQKAAGGPSTDGHGQHQGSSPDQGHAVQHVGDRDRVGSHRT